MKLKLIRFNKIIEYFKNKIKSQSYKNAYLLLENGDYFLAKEKELSKIKITKKQTLDDVRDEINKNVLILKDIIEHLNDKKVKQVIAAKNVMYDIIQPFWTNASFLLSTNNKKDMYELYKEDFIQPSLNYVGKDNKKAKYTCFTCDNRISNLSKPEAFDLTWLVKTGVDTSRKTSHFWNLNVDSYICPICNLLYSCLPLGFNFVKGKVIFINNNVTIKILKESNSITVQNENDKFESIEQMSYLNIVNSMEQHSIENLDKEFQNIQVVKIDSNNQMRPYSFNVLSPRIMKTIYYNRKTLNSLIKIIVKITDKYYINLYDEVIRRLYDGKNLFDLIHKLMSMNLQKDFKAIYIIYAILKINTGLVGGKDMRLDDINKFKNYGLNLKEKYDSKDSSGKLMGIAYRLLNALKTKDSSKFMDTLINAHMYMKVEIPSDFVKALSNNDMLQSAGYAFLIGLQGMNNENSSNEKNNNENNSNENKEEN